MELIIVIFFFALTSAVCLQVFVRAHDIARETESTNKAILWADNACECFYEFGNDQAKIENTLNTAFDSKEYSYKLNFFDDDQFDYMEFSFYYTPKDELVYTYTFKQHKQEVAK